MKESTRSECSRDEMVGPRQRDAGGRPGPVLHQQVGEGRPAGVRVRRGHRGLEHHAQHEHRAGPHLPPADAGQQQLRPAHVEGPHQEDHRGTDQATPQAPNGGGRRRRHGHARPSRDGDAASQRGLSAAGERSLPPLTCRECSPGMTIT
eukprot:11949-Hanusia_phi.AAC.1